MLADLVRPFTLALVKGSADPAPARPAFTVTTPRWLGLLPVHRLHLAFLADFVIAWVVFGTALNMMISEHDRRPLDAGIGMIYLTAISTALPIVLRHRWPLAAWRILLLGTLSTVVVPLELHRFAQPVFLPGVGVAAVMCLYSVAVRCERQITLAVWVVSIVFMWSVDQHAYTLGAGGIGLTVAALFGYNVRTRRSATEKLAEEEERTRLAEGAQAALAERARIARELHDVVAHHMSVIAIQAEAVPLRAQGDAAQLESGMADIRGLSLEAIAELRRVLGVLRDPEGRTETAPQPGLDRVGELVANARTAGLTVALTWSGSADGVPQAVQLTAYRIVQESLSNVMRHAPGSPVAVAVVREPAEVRVCVVNAAPRVVPPPVGGAGQGLAGMRERVALVGGTLTTGPTPEGGFSVEARLPVEPA
ncbi:sensor histidine kinase [Nonomuraea sp. NPDC050328]|uniref:sensor histidine kinase n=1 Tax=Nonomuraea sp. NPDC050328 TaxID=3364361 RepID=UPI003788AAEB